MTAGNATRMPTAVAINASAMPLITFPIAPAWLFPSCRNAVTMPSTVPNRPMNGALLPSVPRNKSPPSKLFRRARVALARICSTDSTPSLRHLRASPMISASTDRLRPSSAAAAASSPEEPPALDDHSDRQHRQRHQHVENDLTGRLGNEHQLLHQHGRLPSSC